MSPGGEGHAAAIRESGRELARICRLVALPLALGVAAWVVLAPLTSWSLDDSVWWWATVGGTQGITLYHRMIFSYPPLWGELLQAGGWVLGNLGVRPSALGATNVGFAPLSTGSTSFSIIVTSPLFNLLTKGVLLLFDIGTGLLLFGMVRRATGDEQRARMAFTLWFVNPIVVVESSVFAGFDLLVAFFVIAAIVLLFANRPAWAGVATALAILTKGTPIFLLPLFAVFLFDRNQVASVTQGLRRIGTFVAGGVAAAVVLLAPVAAAGELRSALDATSARFGANNVLGGMSVFGLTSLRPLEGVGTWLSGVGALGRWVLVLQLVVALAATAGATRIMRRDRTFGLVGGTAAILTLIAVLQQVANPQYVLWALPFTVAVVAIWRRCTAALVLVSGSAFLYLVSIGGPAMVVAPIAEYTHAFTPDQVVHEVLAWGSTSRLFWSSLGGSTNFAGPLAVAAVVGTILVVTGTLWRRPPKRTRVIPARLRAGRATIACGALAVTVLGAVVGEGIVAATPQTAGVSLRAVPTSAAPATGAAAQVTVAAHVRSGPELEELHLVAFTAVDVPVDPEVDLYQDAREPVNGISRGTIGSIASQVRSNLANRGFRGSVRTMNANDLSRVLADVADAPHHVIVDMSGILPSSVFSASTNLVIPWLQAGGTLYWGGSAIGTLSGKPGEPDNGPITAYPESLYSAGIARFIDPSLIGSSTDPTQVGTVPTAAARAVGLRYQFNAQGIRTVPATAGIAPIGWVGHGLSSLTVVADGAGRAILFGGPVTNASIVGADVATSLMSAVPWADGPVVSRTVPESIVRNGGTVRWSPPVGNSPGSVVITAIDPTIEGSLLVRTTAP